MGNWEATDIEIEGKQFRAAASWKPVLDGRLIEHRFMLSDSPDEPGLWLLVMIGQDPADQQVKFWGFHRMAGFPPVHCLKPMGKTSS